MFPNRPKHFIVQITMHFVCYILLFGTLPLWGQDKLPPERVDTLIAVFSRLDPAVVDGNTKLKDTLTKLLDATRDDPRFVVLVKKFKVVGRNQDLLAVAAKHPNAEAGVEALQLVLNSGGHEAILKALRNKDNKLAPGLAGALANSSNPKSIKLLSPFVIEKNISAPVRKAAVRGLSRTEKGAKQILAWAKTGKLPANARFTASMELSTARWPVIKTEAAKVLPLPFGQNAKPLPPMAELVKRKGDIKRGESVFFRETVLCARCHQVNGKGIEVGPALSEIGTKLPKSELYEAIFDPNAGISFGYETWTVELKNGEQAFGLIVSDAADELALKAVTGVVMRYKKSEIKSRKQSSLSIMPGGLQVAMSEQDLVDLVEYLSSLKKR